MNHCTQINDNKIVKTLRRLMNPEVSASYERHSNGELFSIHSRVGEPINIYIEDHDIERARVVKSMVVIRYENNVDYIDTFNVFTTRENKSKVAIMLSFDRPFIDKGKIIGIDFVFQFDKINDRNYVVNTVSEGRVRVNSTPIEEAVIQKVVAPCVGRQPSPLNPKMLKDLLKHSNRTIIE